MSKEYNQELNAYSKEIKQLEKKMAVIRVQCSHQDKHGNLQVKSVGGDMFKCRQCEETFKLNPVDTNQLKASYSILSDAINQIKVMADPKEDEVVIKTLGQLQFNIKEAITLYETTMNQDKKKKKNKKKNKSDNYGNYGNAGLW